jgi:hypothetical protein
VTSNVSPVAELQDVESRQIARAKNDIQLPKRKRGAPKGNRNRFKTGLHTNEAKALRKQIAQWKRETGLLLRLAQQSCG